MQLIKATIADYQTIQNMARFYVYDRTKYMGWECPENGMFECIDFKHYFESANEQAFLIRVNDELAGFVLLDKMILTEQVDWNIGEFFVLAKFQGKGIARQVAKEIFKQFPGKWSVAVMPENIKAVNFWRKMITDVSGGNFKEFFKTEEELKTAENSDPYSMNIFIFNTIAENQSKEIFPIRKALETDISAIVALSHVKRHDYEQAQPQFWKHAEDANKNQTKWFEKLLQKNDHVILVAELQQKIIGFIIGRLSVASEVYDPGGLTLLIDDFCVSEPSMWKSVGKQLISELTQVAKTKGSVQILVVCGAHDEPKRQFLKSLRLTIASEWYVGEIV